MSDKAYDKFQKALRDLQIEQWLLSEHAVRWRVLDADDLRQFADHARALSRSFDTLIDAAGALCGAEAEAEGIEDIVADYAGEVRRQADALDEAAREPAAVWSPKLQEYV